MPSHFLRHAACVAVLATSLIACTEPPTTPLVSPSDANGADGAAPPAKLDTKDGLVVLALPAKITELSESLVKIRAVGNLQGKNLGVSLEMTSRFLTLRSPGADGDALLEAIARAYGVVSPTQRLRPEIQLPIELVEGDLKSADRSRVRAKVTIDTGLKSEYAQLYVSFDATRNALEISEMDPSFRTNVVRALSQ